MEGLPSHALISAAKGSAHTGTLASGASGREEHFGICPLLQEPLLDPGPRSEAPTLLRGRACS